MVLAVLPGRTGRRAASLPACRCTPCAPARESARHHPGSSLCTAPVLAGKRFPAMARSRLLMSARPPQKHGQGPTPPPPVLRPGSAHSSGALGRTGPVPCLPALRNGRGRRGATAFARAWGIHERRRHGISSRACSCVRPSRRPGGSRPAPALRGTAAHSPAIVISSMSTEPQRTLPRNSVSLPTCRRPENMSRKLPAMVISSTGWTISPLATQNPAAPRE